MRTRVGSWIIALAAATSVAGGLGSGRAAAAENRAPIASSGSMTVHYEDVYSVHFTASDPEGAPLTVVTQPVNEDWISCDGGPANDFTCDYASNRYSDPAPLPSEPFTRTITYSVSDGTSTSTGVWTITVLPPPTMEIVGRPTVTEGGEAVLQMNLSRNSFGGQLVVAHVSAVDTADGEVTSTTTLEIDIADEQTVAEIRIPVDDDAIAEPTEFFTVSVDAMDAIPFRFVAGGNLVTVLDNDGYTSSDTTAPVVDKHRNVIVERGGERPAWLSYSPPAATDDVDGTVPVTCSPPPMSAMPNGRSQVTCSATDRAGNTGSSGFQVTVRRPKTDGLAKVLGGGRDLRCVAPNQFVWLVAEGFTPGSTLTIQLQTASLDVVPLQTAHADGKGRVRRFVKLPAGVAVGDADVVVMGPAGGDDLVRMLPVTVTRGHHHHGGALVAILRNRECN